MNNEKNQFFYKMQNRKPPVLLDCVCGLSKKRRHWLCKDGEYLQCAACYRKSKPGKTRYEINDNWNTMVKELRNGEESKNNQTKTK